jgi:hypothetical protein
MNGEQKVVWKEDVEAHMEATLLADVWTDLYSHENPNQDSW